MNAIGFELATAQDVGRRGVSLLYAMVTLRPATNDWKTALFYPQGEMCFYCSAVRVEGAALDLESAPFSKS